MARLSYSLLLILGIMSVLQDRADLKLYGTVTRIDTGAFVADATIVIRTDNGILRSKTDVTGKFNVMVPTQKQYVVSASAPGYLAAKDGIGSLVVSPVDLSDISLKLMPASSINGGVTFDSKDTATPVLVTALLTGYDWGKRTLTPIATVETDDHGAYRLEGLPPGQYYVRVEASNKLKTGRSYFPAALAISDAAAVDVPLASQVQLDRIRLQSSVLSSMEGVVSDGSGGLTPDAHLFFAPADHQVFEEVPVAIANAASDDEQHQGRFKVVDLEPGRYHLFALTEGGTPSGKNCRSGAITVTVTADVTKLDLPIRECATLQLTANLLGYSLPDFTGTANVTLLPTLAAPTAFSSLVSSQPALPIFVGVSDLNRGIINRPDLFQPSRGTGMYSGIPVGLYSFLADLRLAYLADVRQGNRSLLQEGIAVQDNSSVPINLVFSLTAQWVRGTVTDTNGSPASRATVVLIPDAPYRKTFAWYKTQVTDERGSFEIRDLAPWTYRLFAWAKVEDGPLQTRPYLNEDYVRQYEFSGTPIDLRARSQDSILVKQIEDTVANPRN